MFRRIATAVAVAAAIAAVAVPVINATKHDSSKNTTLAGKRSSWG